MKLYLTIDGEPVAKERPRASIAHKGDGTPYPKMRTPRKTKDAEARIAEAWQAHHAGNLRLESNQLGLDLLFHEGPRQDEKQQDLDNLVKLVMDALNQVAWVDDRQIVLFSAEVVRDSDTPLTYIIVTDHND